MSATPSNQPSEREEERFSVWEVCNRAFSMVYASREEAERVASSAGATAGISIIERHVYGSPPSPQKQSIGDGGVGSAGGVRVLGEGQQ